MTQAIFDQGPPPPCPAPFNMAAYVLAAGAKTPDKVALSIAGADTAPLTFADIIARVRGFGGALLARGLSAGDRVLLRLGNSADFPITYLGAIAAGLVPVPTSPMLTEPEVAGIIDELAPRLILWDPDVPCPTDPRRIAPNDIAEMQTHAPCDWDLGDPNRLAYIVYTSGTSGRPRAVCHAHRAIWARRMMHAGWYGLTRTDRMMHAGAFNWTYTLGTGLLDPWSVGASAIVPVAGTEPGALPDMMRAHGATLFAAAPGVFRKMLQTYGTLDIPGLRHALSAGEKLSPTLAARWRQTSGTEIYEAYGQSEISTFVSSAPLRPTASSAIGRPQIGRRVAILSEDGTPALFGAAGRIAIDKGDPGLMLGYLGDTPVAQGPDWFETGDLGVMDETGEITFQGRRDDLMNAGGYRVSPLEVEAALSAHHGMDAIAVTDIEVKEDARIIVGFYTGPEALPEAELHAFAAGRLARYKCPKAYVRIDALPTGANGKLARRALEKHWNAQNDQT